MIIMDEEQEGNGSKTWSQGLGTNKDVWETDFKKRKEGFWMFRICLVNPLLNSVSMCWHGLKGLEEEILEGVLVISGTTEM